MEPGYAWQKIVVLLDDYYRNPEPVIPSAEDFAEFSPELNPSQDRIKIRMNRVELGWDWLHKIGLTLRTSTELPEHEQSWRRRYMNWHEKTALLEAYQRRDGVHTELEQRAVLKTFRNMARRGLIWND